MAKLILSLDGTVLKDVPLDKERLTIGRRPHNDLQIDNLAVSGEHALIVTLLNDSFLEDLGSTNGTLVNGVPINKHVLQHNDVVEIGKYRLKYLSEPIGAVPPQATADFEQAIAPGAAAAVPGPTMQSEIRSAGQPLGAIQVLNGPSTGKALDLVKNLTTLGKPGVQVAVITRRPQGYFITHVEGANFPIVNGKALDAQAHRLQDHDVVELAGVKLEFFIKAG